MVETAHFTGSQEDLVKELIRVGVVFFPRPNSRRLERVTRERKTLEQRSIVDFQFEKITPDLLQMATNALKDTARECDLSYQLVAGSPQADSAMLGEQLAKNFVMSVGSGCDQLCADRFTDQSDSRDRVLLVKMLVETGARTQCLVQTFRDAGYTVTDVVTLIDRECGARSGLESMSSGRVRLHAVFTMTDLLELFDKGHYLDDTPTQLYFLEACIRK